MSSNYNVDFSLHDIALPLRVKWNHEFIDIHGQKYFYLSLDIHFLCVTIMFDFNQED